jgi:hypothetical protein
MQDKTSVREKPLQPRGTPNISLQRGTAWRPPHMQDKTSVREKPLQPRGTPNITALNGLSHRSPTAPMEANSTLRMTYEPPHRQNTLLGPGPAFTKLHQMRWAARCIKFEDAEYDLKGERCFPMSTDTARLSSLLFVIGTCVRDQRNLALLDSTVASIRQFHPAEDILVFDNCPRMQSDQVALSHWLRDIDSKYRNSTFLHTVTKEEAQRPPTRKGSLFEFGAFAHGVHFMLREGRHERLVFLQHSTSLTKPLAAQPNRCPVYLQRPWSLWGLNENQHTEFIPGQMYRMMNARGIPQDFILEHTHSWISVGDGTLVLHRELAHHLAERQLLDSAMVDQCRFKGCFESVSGLYGMYAGRRHECNSLQVHAITRKTHGGNRWFQELARN